MTIFKFSKTETQLPRGSKHPLAHYSVVINDIEHVVTVYDDKCTVETGSGEDYKCVTHEFFFYPLDGKIDRFDPSYMSQAFYWKNANLLVAIVNGSHIPLNKTYNALTNAVVLCDPLTAEPKIFLCSNVSRFEINDGLLYCYIPGEYDPPRLNNSNRMNVLIYNQSFELVDTFGCEINSIKNVIKMPDGNFCIFGRDVNCNSRILRVTPDGATIESITHQDIVFASDYELSTLAYVRAIFALPDGHIVLFIADQGIRLCIFDPLFKTNDYEICYAHPEHSVSHVENIRDGRFDVCYFTYNSNPNIYSVVSHFALEEIQT